MFVTEKSFCDSVAVATLLMRLCALLFLFVLLCPGFNNIVLSVNCNIAIITGVKRSIEPKKIMLILNL